MPWFLRGLREGVVTTHYPKRPDPYGDGFPAAMSVRTGHHHLTPAEAAALCPTGAISADESTGVRLDRGRCVLCGRCAGQRPDIFEQAHGSQTAVVGRTSLIVPELPEDDATLDTLRTALAARTALFRRSLHIRHVDAGSDGSEEWEILALTNPVYDIHRLGLFFTASPRHADVLLVTGAGTRGMAAALRRTRAATPEPVVVIAAGTDACSGGLFADTYATHGGVGDLLDVDIWVPGAPPSPFSLLHALLLATGRLLAPGNSPREPEGSA
ncbi:NADH:ubiquinone oxidoreductase [Streptomyces sp. NPDC047046]|uniref:NADH-quinone oxidoreductase subunit B family protein n=1 Tax=Streptomyces sp. NPDC047046 TaxID=3155378 RepID=UPI0033DE89DB